MNTAAATDENVNLIEIVRFSGLMTGLLILVCTWFVVRLVGSALTKLSERFVSHRLLLAQVSTLSKFVLYLIGIGAAAVVSVSISKEVVLALAGTAAVTIGFGLKDVAASVLAGITIIVDRPFQVGDRVAFAGFYGDITEIGLRSVRMVTLEDSVVTIPNNKFLTEAVSSSNFGVLDAMVLIDFFIGVDQDVSLAKQLVIDALTSSRYAYLKKPWGVGVHQVFQSDYYAIRLRVTGYVLDVKLEKAMESDITERVIAAFRKHQVLPPARLVRNLDAAPRAAA